jgi:hypothetical protein
MRSNGAVADVNIAVRKEFAQMIVSSTVTEAQLEHVAVQVVDQIGGQLEAGTLRLQSPNKAVEPTHEGSRGNAGGFP